MNDSRILKLQQIIADRASKKMEYDDTIVHQMIECVKVVSRRETGHYLRRRVPYRRTPGKKKVDNFKYN